MSKQNSKAAFCTAVAIVLLTATTTFAADGFGRSATGGTGGTSVTATTASQLVTYATSTNRYIITVSGTITLSSEVRVTSNKTIRGANTSATVNGNIYLNKGNSNIIIQNLNITNPTGSGADHDGISIKGATNVFITKCTITDCKDGECDITQESDNITVSYCRFRYVSQTSHNFVNLIGASDSQPEDLGKLHVTFHHNWWDNGCKERMPRVRFGRVHTYNNLYSASGSNYCVGVGNQSQTLIESNYFDGQSNAWKNYSTSGNQGLVHWNSGNQFVNCSIPTWAPNSSVFAPPYSYTLQTASAARTSVLASAGNR